MSTQLFINTPQWSQADVDIYEKPCPMVQNKVAIVAERELRETEITKRDCLKQLKIWIQQNEDVKDCITDNNFLLRFLRVKKFSIPLAQQTLLKYLNFRKRFPGIFLNMDCRDPINNELISGGYIVVSPVRDNNGRRVVIYNTSKFDPKKYSGMHLAKAHAIVYETLLAEEDNQILGVTHVADLRGVNPSFFTLFSASDFGYLIKWGEQSIPMRHKEIHLINMPQTIKYVYDFAKSNLSKKLKQRLMVHDSHAQLFESVGQRCFPKEMGGTCTTVSKMIDSWKIELEEKRGRLLDIDRIQLLSDRYIQNSKKPIFGHGDDGLIGSFRRLEVD
ncbi:hypothetical protein ABEB36_001721 [Hypothenemus hampei]|uniref:CRAL-TRIO domain-containing protein n=1 Tax=Hypothenemus hampei TaxID=57062 RepID=A0ABD1FFJ1_HYPHA